MIEVSDVRVFLVEEERLKAYVTLTFNECFVLRDVKVINGNSGVFVAMPSKRKRDGSYRDIAHPIHSDFRNYLEKVILDKYHDELKMVDAGFPVRKASEYDNEDDRDSYRAPSYPTERSNAEAGIGPSGFKK